MTKKLNLRESYSNADFVENSLDELYYMISSLREEYNKIISINSILINSNKAMKNLLLSKKVFTNKEFEIAYSNELKKLEKEYERHMEMQDKLQLEFLINNITPGNS